MTRTLIIKLNATGDVVRTTTLLRRLRGEITWITARNNLVLLEGLDGRLRPLSWQDRAQANDVDYDLVINLEDEPAVASFAKGIQHKRIFGPYLNGQGDISYTEDSSCWFDLSLISRYGREKADQLKFQNRRTYQELLFEGLGLCFDGEEYLLPEAQDSDLSGDVAIAPLAGAGWPMKNWAYNDQLKHALEEPGLKVNVLPKRRSLLEQIGDIRNHRCLVSGDGLPMHIALGTRTPCVSLFICTSPWEIHGYGVQIKIVSPILGRFFYKPGYDTQATTAIGLDEVREAVLKQCLVNC